MIINGINKNAIIKYQAAYNNTKANGEKINSVLKKDFFVKKGKQIMLKWTINNITQITILIESICPCLIEYIESLNSVLNKEYHPLSPPLTGIAIPTDNRISNNKSIFINFNKSIPKPCGAFSDVYFTHAARLASERV